ncbi:MAG: DUF58 domain-containing protein [Fibrobacter sp.]|nr:DUF58 domain-containing protein [Fibrobacter sp.]
MKTASFLKPQHLVPIRNLNLRAKLIVEGMIAGLHKSPFHGFSSEFLEYRHYLPGEAASKIDWRKFAKTDRTMVRLFEDETNLFAHILIDKSASMGFASENQMSKFEYACTLAASCAWILIRQRDAVGVASFDEDISLFLPPKSTNTQLKNIIGSLDMLNPGAVTNFGNALDMMARGLKKRGLCVVISDLFDDPENIIRGLRHLRFKKQDIIVIWLLDPFECRIDKNVTYNFHDLETGKDVSLDGTTASKFYLSGLNEHRSAVQMACRELQIDLEQVSTDEPFYMALMRILKKRSKLF